MSHLKVLLAKGANQLARNKKGRKPGDVFSPTVDEDKKERIKALLGIGLAGRHDPLAGNKMMAAGGGKGGVGPVSSASATSSSMANASVANRGGVVVVDGAGPGGVAATSAGSRAAGGGIASGGSHYREAVGTAGTTAVPPPAYKVTAPLVRGKRCWVSGGMVAGLAAVARGTGLML